MADEEKQVEEKPQEEKPVTEVTDADLASAFDSDQQTQEVKTEIKEEIKEEVQTEEKLEVKEEHQEKETEEPTDNAERSRLGRRLKTIEEQFNTLLTRLDAQPQAQQAPAQSVNQNVTYNDNYVNSLMEAAIERGELPATIVTPHDQFVTANFVKRAEMEMERQYAIGYINTLKAPQLKGSTSDDIHAEVVAELQRPESPFNRKQYFNPQMDAKMNYIEAKNYILEKRLSGEKSDKNVFKGKPKDAPATGTSVSTRQATVANELPALDEASQDFIKRTGMSVESVKAALGGTLPIHLSGRGMR